jgi:glyoxylase-like metal-dependent hydrolase (beta-lactamase superfamily II)
LDEEIVLIDTGCGIETLKQVRKEYDIRYVINSHTHPDHSAGNWVFDDRPIHVPEEGFDTSGDVVALSERFAGQELSGVWQEFVKKFIGFENCRPTRSYNRRTVFNFGHTMFEPIYTPGHTKDHYCFYEQRDKILFSFDYDLTSFPWYGHAESNLPEFEQSVQKLKALFPRVVVSSHRGIIAENIDAEFNKFQRRIDEREEKNPFLTRKRENRRSTCGTCSNLW